MYTYEFAIPILYFGSVGLNFILAFFVLFAAFWIFKFVLSMVVGG